MVRENVQVSLQTLFTLSKEGLFLYEYLFALIFIRLRR